MQTVDMAKCIEGIFVQELKNRFLCEVVISGVSTVCYVPSSCHLSNFLRLSGKRVLLVPTSTPNARTSYALFAVPYKRNYIILNTSMANRAVEACLYKRQFSFLGTRTHVLTEHRIEGYKADLYIDDTNTIVEIKSVLSLDNTAKFPTVFSERSLNQLTRLKELLAWGYRVHYCIVSLNPYVKAIQILDNTAFLPMLEDCLASGMTISGHTCQAKNGKIELKNALPVVIGDIKQNSDLYHEITFKELCGIITDGVGKAGQIIGMMASSAAFGYALTVEKVPAMMAKFFVQYVSSHFVFFLITFLIVLLFGCFLEVIAIIVLVTPILLPTAVAMGIDPIHFGMFMCLTLCLGGLTPPVGLCLITTSRLVDVDIDKMFPDLLYCILIYVAVIALVAIFPELSTYLPSLMM